MFRLGKAWFLLIVLLLVGAVGGYYYYMDVQARSVITYRTEALTEGDVTKKVTATGSLRAVTNTSVGCEVSGKIIKLYVDYNSKVKKGQLLAQIDPDTFQTQVDQQQASLEDAEASYKNAEANLANAQSGIPKADAATASAQSSIEAARATVANSYAGVVTARANVRKARAALENSDASWKRNIILRKRDLVATSDLDLAKSTALQDRSNLDSMIAQQTAAEATYRSNVATLKARQSDLRSAIAAKDGAVATMNASAATLKSSASKVTQARYNLLQQKLNLSHTRIESPIDGIVIDRQVTVGQTVAASFTTPNLFTLAGDLSQMQVEVTVDEADIGQVKVGAPCTFTVDAFPEETFLGNVTEVRLAALNTSGVITYTVIVRTNNPKHKLLPGLTATVGIQVATVEDALLVPNAALRFRPPAGMGPTRTPHESPTASRTPGERGPRRTAGRRRNGPTRLYTLDANKKLVPHRCKLGISDGSHTEILESEPELKEGDEIVVESSGSAATPAANVPGGPGGARGPRMF